MTFGLRRTATIGLTLAGALALFLGQVFPQGDAAEKNGSEVGYSDTPYIPGQKWRVHDRARPKPPKVDPGTPSTLDKAGRPPSDAVVLFDGKDLSKWTARHKKSGQPIEHTWIVKDGYLQVNGDAAIATREKFGDAQIHVEWMIPPDAPGAGQGKGNSGILIQSLYEIQVLESHDNQTYADGQAAAIYGQYPPMVNASRKPGEWQFYDIAVEAPQFEGGKLVKPAFVTVFHNGVLMHHRQEMVGPMAHKIVAPYKPHEQQMPFALQNHNEPVRYRQIWIRPLKGYDQGTR